MAPAVLLWIVTSMLVGYLGRHRRIGFLGFFLASLIFTPVLTFLILILSAPKKEQPRSRTA
jgi:hypothetical protein